MLARLLGGGQTLTLTRTRTRTLTLTLTLTRTIWGFISPLMDKRTRDKTSILGGPKDFTPRLLEWVPADNLPDFLGGKDTSCDFIHEKGPWADAFPAGHMFAPGPPAGSVRRSVSGSLHQH